MRLWERLKVSKTLGYFDSRIFKLYDSKTLEIETRKGEAKGICVEILSTKLTSVSPSESESEFSDEVPVTRRSRSR